MSDKRHATITWTPTKRDKLRRVLEHEMSGGAKLSDVFQFEGHMLVVAYAEYLLKYLDKQLVDSKAKPEPRRAYARSKGGR